MALITVVWYLKTTSCIWVRRALSSFTRFLPCIGERWVAATLSFVESSPSSAQEAFMRTQMLADLNGNTGIEMTIKVKRDKTWDYKWYKNVVQSLYLGSSSFIWKLRHWQAGLRVLTFQNLRYMSQIWYWNNGCYLSCFRSLIRKIIVIIGVNGIRQIIISYHTLEHRIWKNVAT